MPVYDRDYRPLSLSLAGISGDRTSRMHQAADAMWRHMKDHGVTWAGFYLISESHDGEPEMVLGPSRDKPACSPIGMHGACGQVFTKRRPMIVSDVHNLGAGYVACDPRDKAELVLPMFEQNGDCWGVLDLDSFERDAFGEHDARELKKIMEAAGISWPSPYVEPLYY